MYGKVKLPHSHEKAKTGSQRCRTPLGNTTWCENLFRASAGAPYSTWAWEISFQVQVGRVASSTSRPFEKSSTYFQVLSDIQESKMEYKYEWYHLILSTITNKTHNEQQTADSPVFRCALPFANSLRFAMFGFLPFLDHEHRHI